MWEFADAIRAWLGFAGSIEMRKTFCSALLILASSGCSLLDSSGKQQERAVAIQNLVAETQSALALVDVTIREKTNLALDSAQLIINTEIGDSQGGRLDLWMVSGRASREKVASDKVIIKLVPVPGGPAESALGSGEETLSERLAMSIVAAVEGISNVGAGRYPMQVSYLTIEMGITTKTAAATGAGIQFEVIPISVGGEGRLSRANVDILKLEFSHNGQT
jgi:hypothetical protein